VSTTLTSEFLSGLPILGTDYQDVLTLSPGAVDVANSCPRQGARDVNVVTLVDGADVAICPSGKGCQEDNLDSIAEIETLTACAGANFKAAQGALANIVQGGSGPGKERLAGRRSGLLPAFCRLGASRKTYRVGERIDLYVAIKNLSRKNLKVPASLSISDGTASFRVLSDEWTALPQPASGSCPEKKRQLLPGEWIVFKVTLNGAGTYRLDRPGFYHLVFLGSDLGLPDSTQLTLRVEP